MGNRLVLNLLGSAEAILIPKRLIDYGLTNKKALSIYGVLTSMALPFILFPSALTNSMAVLLLPSFAKAQAGKKTKAHFYHGHTVFPVQLLHGYPVHRSFYPVWQKPWHDHFP